MNRNICMALILAAAIAAPAAQAGFVGNWVNIDSTPEYLARVDITSALFQLNVHPWGQCTPLCDWGEQSKSIFSIPGNSFSLVYDFGFKKTTLTLTLVSESSLWVHEFHDYAPGDPRLDDTTDEYFQRQDSGPALPDLQITELTIPKPVVVYGEVPWTWVVVKVRNNGPGILNSGSLIARIVDATHNGQPLVHSGFLSISYSAPLNPGEETTHQFAVGTNAGWPIGQHTIKLRVDPDNTIAESDEGNNLSDALAFDIAHKEYLAGTVTYNHQPLSDFTSTAPDNWPVRLAPGGELVAGYDFSYDPQTGHYLYSGLPNAKLSVSMDIRPNPGWFSMPGQYSLQQGVDLTALTDAAASNYELFATRKMHLLEPFDNSALVESGYPHHCEPFAFKWEAMPGAAKYWFNIDLYRDSEHPSGYGLIGTIVNGWVASPDYDIVLAPSAALEHYQFSLWTTNAAGEQLGYLMITGSDFAAWDYRFKVCGSCPIADINHDCRVGMLDFALMAEHWLESTIAP